jgi:tetratricopeptide (TPR) repeat protein
MLQYPRIPALIALAVTVALGVTFFWLISAQGDAMSSSDARHSTLEQLELVIASSTADAATWFFYGERLREAGRFTHAAQAYKKVLETEPYHREARFHCALSLAQAGDADKFMEFMDDVTRNFAKMAVDIFERREVAGYLSQPRFQEMRRDAQNLAMD